MSKAREILNLNEKKIPVRSIKTNLKNAMDYVGDIEKAEKKIKETKKALSKDSSDKYLQGELSKARMDVEESAEALGNVLSDLGKSSDIDVDSILQLSK